MMLTDSSFSSLFSLFVFQFTSLFIGSLKFYDVKTLVVKTISSMAIDHSRRFIAEIVLQQLIEQISEKQPQVMNEDTNK